VLLHEVANPDFNRKKKFVAQNGKFANLAGMLTVAQGAATAQDANAAMQQAQFGRPVVANVKGAEFVYFAPGDGGTPNMMAKPKAIEFIQYWMGQQEGEPHPNTRMGDSSEPQEGEGEVEGEPGFVEVDKDAEEAPEEKGVPEQPVDFTTSQREGLTKFFERVHDFTGNIDEFINGLLKTINTPHGGTNAAKGLKGLLGSRPDLATKVKQEMANACALLAGLGGKIEPVQLHDKSTVYVIRKEKMTGEEDHVRQITTIRSKGEVCFGRADVPKQPGFENLQEFIGEYDSQRYGSNFGKLFSEPMARVFDEVRILPQGQSPEEMSREEFEKLEPSTRQSTNAEKGGTKLGNNLRGLLLEDLVQVLAATLAGDKKSRNEAKEQLKKRLIDAKELSETDLDKLESVLLHDEFAGILELQELSILGISPDRMLHSLATQMGKTSEVLLDTLGLARGGIAGVERPSKGSTMGEKSDIDIILADDAVLPPKWKHSIVEKEGKRMLRISLKFIKSLEASTPLGTGSMNKAYGRIIPGNEASKAARDTADALHDTFMEDFVNSGALTSDQAEICTNALEYDRRERARLEEMFESFTSPNESAMISWATENLDTLSPENTKTEAGRRAFEDSIASIKDLLVPPTSVGDRQQASQKIWQLHRMAHANGNTEESRNYARGSALTDAIFSTGTTDNEIIARGSPGRLSLASNHELMRSLGVAVFGGTAAINGNSSTIFDEDGVSVFRNRVIAKTREKGRKLIAEGNLTKAGNKRYFETTDAIYDPSKATPAKEAMETGDPNVEQEEGDEQEGAEEQYELGTWASLFSQLPSPDTGRMKQVGKKVVLIYHPFCLKVKADGEEFEGGFPSKKKALAAMDLVHKLARERGEKLSVKVIDYDAGRTIS
jgi:hypothetical protein